ncbi:MAG: O-antigen ligase family protein [Patescibacteria group bacterium]
MFKYFKILFFVLIAYLPYQISLNPLPGIDLASGRIIIAILIVYWLYYSFFVQKQEKFLGKRNLIGIFLVLFLLWSVFSLIWADNFPFAFRKVIFLLNILPLYFVAQMFLQTKKDLRIFFKTLIYSSAGVAVVAISQFSLQFIYSPYFVFNKWFLFYPLFFGKTSAIAAMIQSPNWLVYIDNSVFMRSIGSFPDPNTFGFYLSFIIPGAFLIKEKYFKIIGALLILSLLFAFSRGAYLGVIISLIILLLVNLKFKTKNEKLKLKKKSLYSFKFLIVVFIFSFLIFSLAGPVRQRLVSSFDFQDKGVSERIEIWSTAFNVIKENPILGVGIGNYTEAVDLFSEQRGYRSPIHAHNIYLQIAAELGIIGLILWIFVFVFALKNLYHFYSRSRVKVIFANNKGLFMTVFLSLIWFSIHGLFDLPIFSPRILPLLVIFLALSGKKLEELS